MGLFDLKAERHESLNKAEAIVNAATNRPLTVDEQRIFDAHMAEANRLGTKIEHAEDHNSLAKMFNGHGFNAGNTNRIETSRGTVIPGEHPTATAFRDQFAGWMNNTLRSIGGGAPQMEAAAPSGTISIGTGAGLDSIAITVPTEVLPHLPSYFALDSFGMAGATQIFTDHTRPLVKPILSAGAADAVYAENAAPSTSNPFGVSGFTFGGT